MANRSLTVRVPVAALPWDHKCTVVGEERRYTVGHDDGCWKISRQDERGKPLPFSDGRTEHFIAPGCAADCCDLEVDDDFISVSIPALNTDSDDPSDPQYSDYISEDDGETWQPG